MTRPLAPAAGLLVAGVAFATYPALRPYGPESGPAGAEDFASAAWLASHVLGMVGFVTLAFVLRSAAHRSPWPWTGRPVHEAETRMWLATALLLPYYGAEAYGLNEVGRYAAEQHDAGVLEVADAFRYAPWEVGTFTAGLLLLALVGGRLAHGMWRTGRIGRTGGILTCVGLASYLPQFFGTPGLRVAHGVGLGLGLILMALATRGTDSIADPAAAPVGDCRGVQHSAMTS